MRNALLVLAVSLLSVASTSAQDADKRAWQQRLSVRIPIAVPAAEVTAINPFSTRLSVVPELIQSTPPRKFDVRGTAVVAAYVDYRGECQGAVPLELPYSGVATFLVQEFEKTKFEAARRGQNYVPSWVVVSVPLETRVKEATIRNQGFELPDPELPAVPVGPTRMEPSGHLRTLPATNPSILTSKAAPRRFHFRTRPRTRNITIVSLVHVTAEGICDRYVPLEMDTGMKDWFEAFLGTWRFDAAKRGDESVDCWMTYTATVAIETSSIKSDGTRVLRDRVYSPEAVSN